MQTDANRRKQTQTDTNRGKQKPTIVKKIEQKWKKANGSERKHYA